MERSSSSVAANIQRIRAEIEQTALACGRNPGDVHLMAVTKTVPTELVNVAIDCGIKLLGENRAQEMLEKYDDYYKDGVDVHFIGHLQTNKVKSVVGKVSMIHSVDSLKLAKEISRQSENAGCVTKVLIEVNVGGELSKDGIEPEKTEELARRIAELPSVSLCGLMTIPPICDEILQIERYFSRMQSLLVDIQGKNIDNISMDILSMGMSGDYLQAIKHGSNILRLGSAIFGSRTYSV